MTSVSTVGIAILPVLLATIIIIISVFIGIYVYRDATRRRMNAALWTLVAILAPALIGFIVYLLVRNNYSDLKCSRCDTSISEEYVICPKCGAKLRPSCPNCATPVEPDWRLCPKCTYPLPEQYESISSPKRPKDTTLRKILIAVIAIPILLIVMFIILFALFGVASYSGSNGSSATISTITLEELYNAQKDTAVKDWIESLEDNPNKAYALEYVPPQRPYEYYYLLYVPGGTSDDLLTEFGEVRSFFSTDVLRVGFFTEEAGEDVAYCIAGSTERKLKLEVYCNDVELECEVVSVHFNPTIQIGAMMKDE